MDKEQKNLVEKQHKELVTILIQIGHQLQEQKKIFQNLYNEVIFYHQNDRNKNKYPEKNI